MTYKFKLIYVKIKIGDSMASRMERFHNQDSTLGKRVQRNKDLYKHIYDDESYSNIEGVFETDSNTVNINKLKETIEKHEKLNNDKKQLVKRDVDLKIPQAEEEPYEKENYDINNMLNKAKEEKVEDEIDRYRSLKIEEYELLKKIKEKNKKFNIKEKDQEIKDELMNTRQLTKEELEQIEDSELCIDLFEDLQNDTIGGESKKSIKELINEAKEENDDEEEYEDTAELDESFNTASLKLSKKDYDNTLELDDIKVVKKKNKFVIFIYVLLIIALLAGIGYAGYQFLK